MHAVADTATENETQRMLSVRPW